MISDKLNDHSQIRKQWSHTLYSKNDLPAIGLFFKELYMGDDDYGNMGFFHWKIIIAIF